MSCSFENCLAKCKASFQADSFICLTQTNQTKPKASTLSLDTSPLQSTSTLLLDESEHGLKPNLSLPGDSSHLCKL